MLNLSDEEAVRYHCFKFLSNLEKLQREFGSLQCFLAPNGYNATQTIQFEKKSYEAKWKSTIAALQWKKFRDITPRMQAKVTRAIHAFLRKDISLSYSMLSSFKTQHCPKISLTSVIQTALESGCIIPMLANNADAARQTDRLFEVMICIQSDFFAFEQVDDRLGVRAASVESRAAIARSGFSIGYVCGDAADERAQ